MVTKIKNLALTPEQKRAMLRLRKQGKSDGFVTVDQVMEVLPEVEKHLDDLDAFFGKLFQEKIDVLILMPKIRGHWKKALLPI